YSPAGDDSWSTISTDTTSPYSASFDTTGLEGDFDLRVVAVDGAGNVTYSTTLADRHIDHVNPTVTLNDPGRNVHGTVALSATAVNVRADNALPTATLDDPDPYGHGVVGLTSTTSDTGSGIAHVGYDYCAAGAETWASTDAAWDTTALAEGDYDLRVSATDK